MKKILCYLLFAVMLLFCNNEADKTSTPSTDSSTINFLVKEIDTTLTG